ncbi:MAG: DNA recombination protein RmuC [Pseudomonadota bacterium]|jgi:DNA recombination protein RmuC|nr:DNA recombination protein RmuC [Pseudomonadota bacterium]
MSIALAVIAALLTGALLGFLLGQVRAMKRTAVLSAQLQAERSAASERSAALEVSERRLRESFESLAAQALKNNSEMFLAVARETLGREQALAQGGLKARETAIAQLLEPLRAALEKTEQQVQALERERREAYSALRTQIESLANGHSQLQRETRNLVTALRRPEVRGRWGELTLRRLVELAGLSEHCDFTEQAHLAGAEGVLRPDLVVHMPEARDLVIDVKTPLDAYLEALEAPSEEARQSALRRHAQQLDARIRELAAKAYWAQFEHSPQFVVLFLPGDQFLGAALAERPELIEGALAQNIIIATPSTLMALLKTVAYGWRQSALADNAALVRALGQELYRRLGSFTGHLQRLGQRLEGSVDAYNAAVGSLERQVLPQARRFSELGVPTEGPLEELAPIEQPVRSVSARTAGELGAGAPSEGL